MEDTLLEVRDLQVEFSTKMGIVRVLDKVNLKVDPRQTVGIIGESGCGKSMMALSIRGLVPIPPGRIAGGEILYRGTDLLTLEKDAILDIRGKRIAMIFQEPMNSLNPVFTVGQQLSEVLEQHLNMTGQANKAKCLELLNLVSIPDPASVYDYYPFKLSGGMRQRVMIAMALVNQPELLIADEPTTALDVTIQAQIMELIWDMNRKMGTAVLLISHDLGVIRQMCSRVYIMYAGRVVESGETQEVLAHPLHPYTKGLIASIPSLEKRGQRLSSIPGTVPALEDRSEHGCPFYNRCQSRRTSCQNETPPMVVHKGHMALCVNAKEELGL